MLKETPQVPSEQSSRPKLDPQPMPVPEVEAKSKLTDQVMADYSMFIINPRDLDCYPDRELGESRSSRVIEGEWKLSKEKVAIKKYTKRFNAEIGKCILPNDYLNEIKTMITVCSGSKYLVQVWGILQEETHYSPVMEHMPGGSLFALLHSTQEITWLECYQIAWQIAQGVQYLHAHGWLHRDIKSSNVLLDASGQAKLSDLGSLKLKADLNESKGEARKSQPLGTTIFWLDPEVLGGRAAFNESSDIYSLGMLFWEMASRRKTPYNGNELLCLAHAVLYPDKREKVPDDTPEAFKKLIEDCCSRKQSARPKADKIVERLSSLIELEDRQKEKIYQNEPNETKKSQVGTQSPQREKQQHISELKKIADAQEKSPEQVSQLELPKQVSQLKLPLEKDQPSISGLGKIVDNFKKWCWGHGSKKNVQGEQQPRQKNQERAPVQESTQNPIYQMSQNRFILRPPPSIPSIPIPSQQDKDKDKDKNEDDRVIVSGS